MQKSRIESLVIPMFINLKNKAFKERNWKTIIDKKGTGIDFKPNAITFANIFKINLLQFADVINDITNFAIKELNIKNEIKKISENMNKMQFEIEKEVLLSLIFLSATPFVFLVL